MRGRKISRMAGIAMFIKNCQKMPFSRFVESDMFWVAYGGAFALIILIGNLWMT